MATPLTGKLRPYQHNIIFKIIDRFIVQRQKTCLIAASTGSGKTLTFVALIEELLTHKPGLRVVFMINRVQLVRQLEAVLLANGFECGVACGTMNRRELDRQFTIASYLSIINVSPPIPYNLIIWDEAHNFAPMLDDLTSPLALWYKSVRALNPLLRDIGFTATPYTAQRLIYGEWCHFKDIAFEVRMKELLDQRYLVPAMSYAGAKSSRFNLKGIKLVAGDYALADLQRLANDDSLLKSQVVDAMHHINKHERRCVVWQCVGIFHCREVAARLRELGETVAIVHSETDYSAELLEFEEGKRRHLVFVTIVATGYDLPRIDAIVILRPTRSPVLMVQAIGRALRIWPGKQYALVLDYGDVIKNCGPIDYPYIRQKDDTALLAKTTKDVVLGLDPVVECLVCGYLQFIIMEPTSSCVGCGASLYEQHASADRERTTKAIRRRAAKYQSLYSDIEAVPVVKMTGKWVVTKDLSHSVTFCYNDTYTESFYVPPYVPRRSDAIRMGKCRSLSSRMKKLGCVGNTLQEMAMSQRILYMPQALLIADGKVLEISGWQLLQRDQTLEITQERLL